LYKPSRGGYPTKDRTVAEHIRILEEKRNWLSVKIIAEPDKSKCNQLETELRAVESALSLFRSALEVEAGVALHIALGAGLRHLLRGAALHEPKTNRLPVGCNSFPCRRPITEDDH
jgi:hypothetical protein